MLTTYELEQKRSLPLEDKVVLTRRRISDFYSAVGKVCVSFSGGKDSTVLLHIARAIDKEIPAVFCDTGLEFPEIKEFVRQTENVTIIKPRYTFLEVLKKYGYPVISKEVAGKVHDLQNNPSDKLLCTRLFGDEHGNGMLSGKWQYLASAPFQISDRCCDVMKKNPFKIYYRATGCRPILGMMAEDSSLRLQAYLKDGCNAYTYGNEHSTPIAFWTNKDIWDYLHRYNVPYSSIYNKGYVNTGCMFCMFGVHLEENSRFKLMKQTHPELYDYCINYLGCGKVLDYFKVEY